MNNSLIRATLAGAFLMITASVISAQPLTRGETRTVAVTGEAEIRVVPDEVTYNFGIETTNKDIEAARTENDRRVKELLDLTRRLGIDARYVQTDYMVIEPDYMEVEARYGEPRVRKLVGYITRRNIAVTLKDLAKVEELVAESLKLGVNSVDQGEFRTADLRKHRDQARLNAARAAREKAAALAGELGAKIGRPVSISEDSLLESPWSIYGRRNRAMTQNSITEMAPMPMSSGGTIAPGQIVVAARVNVVFELE